MKNRNLICVQCHEKYEEHFLYECPKCGGILQVSYKEGFSRKHGQTFFEICDHRFSGLWRYRHFLPDVHAKNVVSLGEGCTAVVHAKNVYHKIGIRNLYLKSEFSNPTASFKDRPTSVGISVAKEHGIRTVAVASTGNAGVSASAYAAKAGMKCLVCAPRDTAKGKLAQLTACGASIFCVDGNYSDCFNMVKEACETFGYVNLTSTYINPYTVEADKTVAYELYEQFHGKVPDWIMVPIGTGPLLSGIWRGYQELKELGYIENLPSMVGVQAENCAPIAKAFCGRKKVYAQPGEGYTIAGGIADQLEGYEKDGEYTIQQIKDSGGECIALSEQEIFEAWHELCLKEGIFAEPAGAVSAGAVKKLVEHQKIGRDDFIVAIITAHGLKYPDLPNRLENRILTAAKSTDLRIE